MSIHKPSILVRSIHIVKSYLVQPRTILSVYLIAAFVVSLQQYQLGKFNNFKIFCYSFLHLVQNQNLHTTYPEHYDIFLYHPSFAVLFAPFYFLPYFVGIWLWTSISAFAVYRAIEKLPLSINARVFIEWFILIGLVTSLQHTQTNPVIAAAMIFTFVYLEKRQAWQAAFFATLVFFIKVFGACIAALVLFYRQDLRRNALAYILVFTFLSILPAFIIGFETLPRLYQDWFQCLQDDHKVNYGVSIIGLLHGAVGAVFNPFHVQLAGLAIAILFFIYLWLYRFGDVQVRLLALAYWLMWCILFNHAAETNTQIISIIGAAIWFVVVKQSRTTIALIVFVFLLTELALTDIMPKRFRLQFITPYALNALPILLVWLRLHYDIWTHNIRTEKSILA